MINVEVNVNVMSFVRLQDNIFIQWSNHTDQRRLRNAKHVSYPSLLRKCKHFTHLVKPLRTKLIHCPFETR